MRKEVGVVVGVGWVGGVCFLVVVGVEGWGDLVWWGEGDGDGEGVELSV